MLRVFQQTALRRLCQPRFFFSYELMKKSLSKDLFSIELINKGVNRRILAMAYSPGVGGVCEAIEKDHTVADTMTLRPRSVAIVTDGSFLDCSAEGVTPAMDWLIAQVKYYSGLDAFPFVVSKDINLEETLKDLATSYATVLYLDNKELGNIPNDLLVVRHSEVIHLTRTQLTDAEKTSNVLAYLINKKVKGLATAAQLNEGLDYQSENFKNFKPYSHEVKDGRDIYTHALQLHAFYTGKIHVELGFHDIHKIKPYFTEENLRRISKEPSPYSKTSRLSAIVTDGTSILGYGNIGPRAGLPVMEGKSLLFKLLGDVEVVPICMYPRPTTGEAIQAIVRLLGNFDAINLEDIKAPECFDIEEGLNALKVLPIFHDDQHGTAIVTLAGLINAVKVVEKDLRECKVIINGAGAAGITIAKLLLSYGVKDIILCDSTGSIYRGRTQNMNEAKRKIA
jgi:malic enzyme